MKVYDSLSLSFLFFESHFFVLCLLLFLIIIIMSVAKLFYFPQSWLETWEIQANIKSWFPDQTTWTKEGEKKHTQNSKSSTSFYRALNENKIKNAKEPRTVENKA